jgi:hypothetical protein
MTHKPATPLPFDSFGIAHGFIVSASAIGDIPLNSRVLAKIEPGAEDAIFEMKRRANAYPRLVAHAKEMRIAFSPSHDWSDEWALSWHDRLVALEIQPSTDNIRRAVLERHDALLRDLGED